MRHSEQSSEGFYSILWFYTIVLPSLSAISASFLTLSLWPLNGIFWIKQFHSIFNGSDSVLSFLNTSLVSSVFSLFVKWNTFFIRIFLPLCQSLIQRWFVPPFFENFLKILFLLPVKEKTQWSRLYIKQQQIYLEAERPQQVS